MSKQPEYPDEAKSPEGTYWWRLTSWPGQPRKPFGAERRLAAWLRFNVVLGGEFTIPQARMALGDGVVQNNAEHFNRRLRKLREDGWVLDTSKDDGSIKAGYYRIRAYGWDPSQGDRDPSPKVSNGIRRRVFERDGRRCVVCGVASGEAYPDGGRRGAITVGHRVPNNRGGSAEDLDNLQTECTRCNESVRDQLRDPEILSNVIPDLLKLRRADAKRLMSWVVAESRLRDKVDHLYDRYRALSTSEQATFSELLEKKSR